MIYKDDDDDGGGGGGFVRDRPGGAVHDERVKPE